MLGQQLSCVHWVHAATVQYAQSVADFGEAVIKPGADDGKHVLGVCRRGGAAGPDRPDGVVGDHQLAGGVDLVTVERALKRGEDDSIRAAGATFLLVLTDTQDGGELVSLGGNL